MIAPSEGDASVERQPPSLLLAAEHLSFGSHLLLQAQLHGRTEGGYGWEELAGDVSNALAYIVGEAIAEIEADDLNGLEIAGAFARTLDHFMHWIDRRVEAQAAEWLANYRADGGAA